MTKTKGSKEKQKNINELNLLNSKTERKMRKLTISKKKA